MILFALNLSRGQLMCYEMVGYKKELGHKPQGL